MKTYGLCPGKPNNLVGRVDHKLEKKITNCVKCSDRKKNGAVIENEVETLSDLELSKNPSPWSWDFSRSTRSKG